MSNDMAAGSVIDELDEVVHPFVSVTTTVYVPTKRDDAVAPFPPAGDHEYEYGEEPPFTFTDKVPVLPPLHFMSVFERDKFIAEG